MGAALAVVNPIGQAIICDVVPEAERGWAFGLLQSVSSALTMLVTSGTTTVAMMLIHGVAGWRIIYLVVAALSALLGIAVEPAPHGSF